MSVDLKTSYLAHEPTMDGQGRWAATPGSRWGVSPQTLCVYDTATGRKSGPDIFLDGELIASTMSADGRYLAALTSAPGLPVVEQNENLAAYGRRAGRIAIWDWRNTTPVGEALSTASLPLDGAFSPDGKWLAAVCASGEVVYIDVNQSKVVESHRHPGPHLYGFVLPRRMVRFSHRGDRFLTLGFGSTVRIWTTKGTLVAELPHPQFVYDANFSAQGEHVVTACEDGTVKIWDSGTGESLGQRLQHPDCVLSAAFDLSARHVVTACRDGMARIWDWRTGQLDGPGLGHPHSVFSAVFSNDGRLIVTAGAHEVRFWETRSGKQIAPRRSTKVNEPRLLLNDTGNAAVIAGTNPVGVAVGSSRPEDTSFMAMISLEEFQSPDDFPLRGDSLQTYAEIVAGRRAERGGSVLLTSDEWLERWQAFGPKALFHSWEKAERTEPNDWRRREMWNAELAKEWSRALAYADHLLQEAPADMELLAHKSLYLVELGRHDEAVGTLQQVSSLGGRVETSWSMAETAVVVGDAYRQLGRGQSANANPASAREWLAHAVDWYTRAIRAGAAQSYTWANRSACQRRLGTVEADKSIPPDWRDAALFDVRAPVEPAVAQRIEASQGLLTDAFALCQNMPLADFKHVVEPMKASGYRPVRCRPYLDDDVVKVAAVWLRDWRDWQIEFDLTAEEVSSRHERWQGWKFIAEDVAGYLVPADDAYLTRFVAIWGRPFSLPAQTSVYAGLPSYFSTFEALRNERFGPQGFQEFAGVEGRLLYSGIWAAAAQSGYARGLAPDWLDRDVAYVQRDINVRAGRLADRRGTPQRFAAQLASAEEKLQVDADNVDLRLQRAIALYHLGRLEEALGELSWIIDRQPATLWAYHYRSQALARLNRQDEARDDLHRYQEKGASSANQLYLDAVVLGYLGDDAGLKRFDDQVEKNAANPMLAYNAACAYALVSAALPNRSATYARRAVELLKRSIETGYDELEYLQFDPDLDCLRDRRDYQDLLLEEAARPRYCGVWETDARHVSYTLSGLSPEAHRDRARELAALGYRPIAISVAPTIAPGIAVAASVWRRPTTVLRGQHFAAESAAGRAPSSADRNVSVLAPEYLTAERRRSNLLVDGSVEAGGGSDWSLFSWRNNLEAKTVVSDVTKTGESAMMLRAPEADDAFVFHRVNVKPHTKYLLAGWGKTEDVAVREKGGKMGASLSVWGGFEASRSLLGTCDWTFLKLVFDTGDRTEVLVGPRLGHHFSTATGTAWFDDLVLVELSGSGSIAVR